MKKIPRILLLITVYLNQLLLLLTLRSIGEDMPGAFPFIVVALIVASFVLAAVNIVVALVGIFRKREGGSGPSLRGAMIAKLALAPFFVLHVFWCLLLFGGFANPWLMWFIPALPFLFLPFAFAVLAATSAYVIAEAVRLTKSKQMTVGRCILHVILQLLFVADVIDSVCLFVKYRKN